jgi:hypothetical protein
LQKVDDPDEIKILEVDRAKSIMNITTNRFKHRKECFSNIKTRWTYGSKRGGICNPVTHVL